MSSITTTVYRQVVAVERITDLTETLAGAQQDCPDVSVRVRLVDGPIDQAIVDQSEVQRRPGRAAGRRRRDLIGQETSA